MISLYFLYLSYPILGQLGVWPWLANPPELSFGTVRQGVTPLTLYANRTCLWCQGNDEIENKGFGEVNVDSVMSYILMEVDKEAFRATVKHIIESQLCSSVLG